MPIPVMKIAEILSGGGFLVRSEIGLHVVFYHSVVEKVSANYSMIHTMSCINTIVHIPRDDTTRILVISYYTTVRKLKFRITGNRVVPLSQLTKQSVLQAWRSVSR